MKIRLLTASVTSIAVLMLLVACQKRTPVQSKALAQGQSATAAAFYADDFAKRPSPAVLTELGRAMFSETSLSASGTMSCATCHDPRHAYGSPNRLAVQVGGSDLQESGTRAVPSLRYLQNVPPFSEHHFDEAVDESQDQGPTGGHTWDGRADTVHDQARLPLFSRLEMANVSADAVVAKVRAKYEAQFRAAFGDTVFDDPSRAFKAVLLSLEVFQQNPEDFYPYSSKYDAWLRGKARLSRQEQRGLTLFNDPQKGNCASCHPSRIRQGSFPQFTDYGFIALGVPRNMAIPANRDPNYYDLGLCGPERQDLQQRKEYCGLFRAPSLRNVSLRQVYFHNGVFSSLRQVLEFYVQRDLNPGKWYRAAQGKPSQSPDDLPFEYRGNINTEAPFGGDGRKAPALSSAEIDAVIAFLGTLNDGYVPGA
jgi:cytochrome c peroxidase